MHQKTINELQKKQVSIQKSAHNILNDSYYNFASSN